MEVWDLHETKGIGDRIRPKREDVLKLKRVLREKYEDQDKGSLYTDIDSMSTHDSSVYNF